MADNPQTIVEHLEELRWRLLKIGIAVLVGGIISVIFADTLREILQAPFHAADPTATLQTFAPAEQWGVLMRIAMFGGLILASPVVLYQTWAFVNPALTTRERNWALPIVGALAVLFLGGVLLGYTVMPMALDFLLGIFEDVDNNLRMSEYYSFTLRFLFAFGVAFLYPVFLFAVAAAGVISSEQLARGRRWAVLLVVIGAALITPTGDAFNLLVLAAPLYLMYEIVYWLVRLVLKK
jgi:sec-independent protein translocase protein TatC